MPPLESGNVDECRTVRLDNRPQYTSCSCVLDGPAIVTPTLIAPLDAFDQFSFLLLIHNMATHTPNIPI